MLEQLIRPFESPQSLVSKRIIPATTQQPAETAGAIWGIAGDLPEPNETEEPGPALQISFKVNTKKHTEKNLTRGMETEKVRVEQTDNPDNFVILERIKKLKYGEDEPPVLKSVTRGSETVSVKEPVTTDSDLVKLIDSWVTHEQPLEIDQKELSITWPPAPVAP